MNETALPVLDLAVLRAGINPKRGRALAVTAVASVALLAVLVGWTIRASMPWATSHTANEKVRGDLAAAGRVADMTVDDRSQLVAEGDLAEARNAEIPFSATSAVPMAAFRLAAEPSAAASALKCLTQAIYYEAATEPLPGRRAVAQVVLNRVRHPAYPKSICGVVYQGSERTTGCQFSFTCDGSLLRAPMRGPWAEAERIAREALAGRVEPDVGTATHYHADYVLPRWAFEMDKIRQLGRHLFYRFEGTWGMPRFFAGQYNRNEMIPTLDEARLRTRLLSHAVETDGSEQVVPGLSVTRHITDRHAENDVGGRLDTTRGWRLTIPDPVEASSRYRASLGEQAPDGEAAPATSGTTAEIAS